MKARTKTWELIAVFAAVAAVATVVGTDGGKRTTPPA